MSPGEGLPVRHTSLQGSGRGCPLLRASNEHSFTVRVLRTRRAPGHSLSILLRPRVGRAQEINRPPSPSFQVPSPTSLGGSLVDPLVRASNEHTPILRAPGAC